ncbi:MAG: zinc ABC transporter substrate-binding protein [Oscillospiraceae bacterium]|nr:zinc ABC transporter substrate-binding protein [Oscillospiraceae bacterium]
MKKILAVLLGLLMLTGCAAPAAEDCHVAATTAPVYSFTCAVAEGTDVKVGQVIGEAVSCLHDYALSVRQMETMADSDLILTSGLGLEDFMEDILPEKTVALSAGVETLGEDPHYWLSPDCAAVMAENICAVLSEQYPEHRETFRRNADTLLEKLGELQAWGEKELSAVSCRELVTFHDGFSYLASAFDLQILAAVEEESGSEASAADITQICGLVESHGLPCVFTEKNGSDNAASVIAAETGCKVYALDMAMGGDWFEAMTHNINTLKEALS